jgi:hypothetical protein
MACPSCCWIDAAGRPAIRASEARRHRVVVGEAARREHHSGARPDRHLTAVLATADPDDPAVGLHDQALHPHVVERASAGRRGGLDERLHQHVAGAGFALLLVRHLRDVPAWGGEAIVLNG